MGNFNLYHFPTEDESKAKTASALQQLHCMQYHAKQEAKLLLG